MSIWFIIVGLSIAFPTSLFLFYFFVKKMRLFMQTRSLENNVHQPTETLVSEWGQPTLQLKANSYLTAEKLEEDNVHQPTKSLVSEQENLTISQKAQFDVMVEECEEKLEEMDTKLGNVENSIDELKAGLQENKVKVNKLHQYCLRKKMTTANQTIINTNTPK